MIDNERAGLLIENIAPEKMKKFSFLGKHRVIASGCNSILYLLFILYFPRIPHFYPSLAEKVILFTISITSFLLCLWTLFDTSTTIPGYLPTGDVTNEEFLRLAPTKIIQGETVYLKYCHTCKIIRDVRSFHCNACGHCIERHDHHCAFVSNCIGKNNTNKFYFFLLCVSIHSLIVFITTIFKFITTSLKLSEEKWDIHDYFAVFIGGFSGVFFLTITGLLIFHTYLISVNITTNEFMRKKTGRNIFNEGCVENWRLVFCC